MRINPVKLALSEGRLQLGTNFGHFRSTEVPRILSTAGFHWAFIDCEHGVFDIETVYDLCRASVYSGLSPVVRVASLEYDLIARALEQCQVERLALLLHPDIAGADFGNCPSGIGITRAETQGFLGLVPAQQGYPALFCNRNPKQRKIIGIRG